MLFEGRFHFSLVRVRSQRAKNLIMKLGVLIFAVNDSIRVRLGRIEFARYATIQARVPVIVKFICYFDPCRAQFLRSYAA